MPIRTCLILLRVTAVAALLGVATDARAQLASGDGFLFRTPRWRVAMNVGFAQPRAQSDIFEFVTEELTLERGDFGSAEFAVSVGSRVNQRLEIGATATFAGRSISSESRDFVGEDDLPIRQQTRLDRSAILATGRLSLAEPGRAIGRFVWIPTKVVPFIGGGAGAIWYRLQQDGEFVDRETLDIFADQFQTSAWAPAAAAFGGADISLTPRFGMTAEGRYLWAKGAMRSDYTTFNKIDLAGYDASIGIYVRF